MPSVSLLIGLQKLFALNTTRSICINVSPEVLELLCRYISSPLIDDELRVLRPERCCKSVCENECFDQWPFFWTGWFGVNVEIAMLVFDACLLWFILIMIEHRGLRTKLGGSLKYLNFWDNFCFDWSQWIERIRGNCWNVPQFRFTCAKADKELRAEEEKCRQVVEQNRTADHAMVVLDLTKVYPSNNFKAVDWLSFAVEKGEFFGLLGVNGEYQLNNQPNLDLGYFDCISNTITRFNMRKYNQAPESQPPSRCSLASVQRAAEIHGSGPIALESRAGIISRESATVPNKTLSLII